MKTRKMIKMAMVASALVLFSLNAGATSIITLNSGGSPQPANSGEGTILTWLNTAITTYNVANNPDLPGAVDLGHFRVNTGETPPVAGFPIFQEHTLNITIPDGYDYLVLHWGGSRGGVYQSYYLDHVASTYDFTAPGKNGLSWYALYNPNSSTVPIPGAAWLLGSGILGLAGIRRKMRKN